MRELRRAATLSMHVALLLALLLSLSVPSSRADNDTQQSLQAERYLRAGRWSQALKVYRALFRSNPRHRQLRQKINLCRAHIAVRQRQTDPRYGRDARRLSRKQIESIFCEVWALAQQVHIEPPSLSKAGLQGLLNIELRLRSARDLPPELREDLLTRVQELRRRLGLQQLTVKQLWSMLLPLADQLAGTSSACEPNRPIGRSFCGNELLMEMVYGVAESLDYYSCLLPPWELRRKLGQLEGQFVGLGIDVELRGGWPTVVDVIGGSPAAEAGLARGDVLAEVNGKNAEGLSLRVFGALLAGRQDGRIALTVRRPGLANPIRVSVTRGVVHLDSVRDVATLEAAGRRLGYVRLASFLDGTADELSSALARLARAGVEAVIIDLRGNNGGALAAAVRSADLLLSDGLILQVVRRGAEPVRLYRADPQQLVPDRPVLLLVDERTASAAEIMAAALVQNGRAELVGRTTYGKALIQSVYRLASADYGLMLTTARFTGPDGMSYQYTGLMPRVTVPRGRRCSPEGSLHDDPFILAAVRAINGSDKRSVSAR